MLPTAFKFSKLDYNKGDCDEGSVISDLSHLTDHYPAAYKAFFSLLGGALCIFKLGPAWLEPTGPQVQHFIREARPIYGHPIADSWLKIGTDIYKYLDSCSGEWISIDPVAFPMLISIPFAWEQCVVSQTCGGASR